VITLRDHQEANSNHLVERFRHHGVLLDASDMGTGKTFTLLATAKKLGVRPGILCPHAVVDAWEKAAKLMGVEPLFVTNYEKAWRPGFEWGRYYRGHGYVWDKVPVETLMLVDEAHRCRGSNTHNAQMLKGAAYRCRTVLASATPFINPLDAEVIGQTLGLFRPFEHMVWACEHGARKDRLGRWVIRDAEKNLARIRAKLFPDRGVRTTVDQIPGFPETQIIPTLVDLPDVDDVIREYTEALAKRAVHDRDALSPLLRARQFAEIRKAPLMVDMAKSIRAETGWPVVIFVNFDATVEYIAKALKAEYVITGKQTTHVKAYTSQKFGWNKLDYLPCNLMAGGTGVSFHDQTGSENPVPRATIISPGWSAFDFRQALGRVRRNGGARSVQYVVSARGTIEEAVLRTIERKLDNLDTLVDVDFDYE
jgi:hypothetical protein